MLKDKKILIGITGSIAAYKTILLVRELTKAGAEVKVVMTPAAGDFVSPLTLSTLSQHSVARDLFQGDAWANHVLLGRWADLFVIAPLSCNTLAKMAHGACDNLLMAVYLSATCPVVVAPAMDEDMWKHPATRSNINTIQQYGVRIIPVEHGALASGLIGEGRMAEPIAIVKFIETQFGAAGDLKGRKALVSAGPTREAIDPVRYISNHSTGKMGVAIAGELAARGAQVDLVLGPSSVAMLPAGVSVHRVTTADEMYEACTRLFEQSDIAVMSAAVADYKSSTISSEKIKKDGDRLTLEMTRTRDILAALGQLKRAGQVLVGFALETTNERDSALNKMRKKNADMMVLNSLNDTGAGFGFSTNKVTIFEKDGKEWPYEQKEKQQVATDIVDRIVNMLYA